MYKSKSTLYWAFGLLYLLCLCALPFNWLLVAENWAPTAWRIVPNLLFGANLVTLLIAGILIVDGLKRGAVRKTLWRGTVAISLILLLSTWAVYVILLLYKYPT